jgi:AraC family transcriptional regulator
MDHPMMIVPYDATAETSLKGFALSRRRFDPAFPGGHHAHGFHSVILFVTSPGRLESYGWKCPICSRHVAAGTILVWPAYLPGEIRWEKPFDSISVQVSTDLLERVAAEMGVKAGEFRTATLRRGRFIREIVQKLDGDPGPGDELFFRSLGMSLAVHLLREYSKAGLHRPHGTLRKGGDLDFCRLRTYIEDHLDHDLSVKSLAAISCLSPCHFLRKFRAAVGITPHQYIISCRVSRARELLLSGGDLAQIASEVGFANQAHMARHIRQAFGVTPGELTKGRVSPPACPETNN